MTVDWRDIDFSLSFPTFAESSHEEQEELFQYYESAVELWVDTILNSNGHSFGFCGDVTEWGGWYFDTIPVGDDIMLNYDSIGPSSVKLNLVTRDLIVDLTDSDASDKIRKFLNPISGFKRFQNSYEVVLDSVVDEKYGTMRCYGYFTFTADYVDTCHENAAKINRFICDLTGISKAETAKVPGLSAFYAGFNPVKYYRPAYTRNENNMEVFCDFLANKTFKKNRREVATRDQVPMVQNWR